MKPEDFVELGTGIMPIQEIINKANQLGFTYAVLEQDECAGDIIESISKSYNNLNSFQNITL